MAGSTNWFTAPTCSLGQNRLLFVTDENDLFDVDPEAAVQLHDANGSFVRISDLCAERSESPLPAQKLNWNSRPFAVIRISMRRGRLWAGFQI